MLKVRVEIHPWVWTYIQNFCLIMLIVNSLLRTAMHEKPSADHRNALKKALCSHILGTITQLIRNQSYLTQCIQTCPINGNVLRQAETLFRPRNPGDARATSFRIDLWPSCIGQRVQGVLPWNRQVTTTRNKWWRPGLFDPLLFMKYRWSSVFPVKSICAISGDELTSAILLRGRGVEK